MPQCYRRYLTPSTFKAQITANHTFSQPQLRHEAIEPIPGGNTRTAHCKKKKKKGKKSVPFSVRFFSNLFLESAKLRNVVCVLRVVTNN